MKKILFLTLILVGTIVGLTLILSKDLHDTSIIPPETTTLKTLTLVAFGDSLTAGLGVPFEDSYPSILEKKLNDTLSPETNITYRVINMGVSGESTTGGLERVDFVIRQKPDIILLGLGANDMLRATDPTLTRENIRKIIVGLEAVNIPVILLGMRAQASNGATFQSQFDSIYPDLATQYNLPLVPFFLEGIALVPEYNTSDGIHPNNAGYEKIVSENIWPVLIGVLEK